MSAKPFRVYAGWLALVVLAAVLAAGAYLQRRPAPPATRLIIAVARSQDSTLVFVAASRNYFREEGLDVTVQPHEYGKLALDAMLEGKADLATAAETPIMLAVLHGRPVAVVAGIFSSDRNMGIVARRDRGISAPGDLKGRRIAAVPETAGDYFRYAFLAANGLPMGAVQAVALPPDEMADALQAGKVDAVAVWDPFLHQCETRLGPAGIVFPGEHVYTYTFNLVATRRLVTEDGEALQSFLRALKKAERYVDQNPGAAAEIVANATGFDPTLLKQRWANFSFRLALEQTLVVHMENEARWAIAERVAPRKDVPNFLDSIYFGGLTAVSPESVQISHEARR